MSEIREAVCGMSFPDLSAELISDPWQDGRYRVLLTASRTIGKGRNSHTIVIDDPDKAVALAGEIVEAASRLRELIK